MVKSLFAIQNCQLSVAHFDLIDISVYEIASFLMKLWSAISGFVANQD